MRCFYYMLAVVLLTVFAFSQTGCRIHHLRGVSNVCGNGVCDEGEDSKNCKVDCEKEPMGSQGPDETERYRYGEPDE